MAPVRSAAINTIPDFAFKRLDIIVEIIIKAPDATSFQHAPSTARPALSNSVKVADGCAKSRWATPGYS